MSQRKPMSTNAIPRQELDARTDDSHRIGIDACGLAHYFDAHLSTVWTVTALGDIAHTRHLDSLSAWVEFVDADRGWQTCHYSDSGLVDTLADSLRREAV